MTKLTSISAVVMTAMLVVSLFAGFAGVAAAATNPTNGNISPAEAQEGSSAQHTFSYEVDSVSADGGTDTFYLQFTDEYAESITIDDVSAYETGNTGNTFSVTSQEVVDRDGDGTNEAVKVTINPPSAASDVDVSLDVTATLTHPSVDTNTDYAVEGYVVDSANADVNAYAVGNLTVTSDETNIQDGQRYWKGPVLSATNNVSANEVIDLQMEDADGNYEFVREIQATDAGVVKVDSASLDAGSYKLVNSGDTKVAQFDIAVQSLSATADPTEVTNDDTEDADTQFTFTSNRANYDVAVSATGLDTAETKALFGTQATLMDADDDGDDEVVLQGVGSDSTYDVSFTNVDANDYDFTFDVVDTSANSALSMTVGEENPAEATFDSNTYSTFEGDNASITINLENTETADFVLGSSDAGYTLEGTVTDGADGEADGQVTLVWNTYEAGNGSPVTVEDSTDSVTITSENTTVNPGELDTGTYGLDALVNGEQTGISLVQVNDRSTDSLEIGIAPEATDSDMESVGEAANFNSNEVAAGDKVVVKTDVNGIYGYMSETTSFQKGGNTFGVYLQAEEQNPVQNTQPKKLDITSAETYVDEENQTVWFVFDTSNFNLEDGDDYNVSFHVTEDNPYVEDSTDEVDEEVVEGSFSVTERTIDFYQTADGTTVADSENPVIVTQSAEGQVTGTTTLAPGTELAITATAEENSPFISQKTVTVQEDGTFSATYDFSGLDAGAPFTLTLKNYNVTQDAEVEDVMTGSATVEDQTVNAGEESTLMLNSVELSHGGFVVLEDADGNVLGTSERLSEGVTENVEVSISALDSDTEVSVVAYADSDGSGDFTDADEQYQGGALTTFQVTAEGQETATPTPDSTTPTETTPTDTTETTETTPDVVTTTDDDGSQGVPGFGAVLAIIALVGAALLAVRRDE